MTGIHPEIHKQVYSFLEQELETKKKNLKLPIANIDTDERKIQQRSEKYGIGFETMEDVVKELQRPGLDPREELDAPSFKSDVLDVKDLQIGMMLDGVVRNVTDFGAFVDIGLHNDGLVHKSQMANYYVNNPIEVVSVGEKVKVRVLEIDWEREKVSLSMKDPSAPNERRPERREQKDFSQERKSRDEDEGGSSIRSNITFS